MEEEKQQGTVRLLNADEIECRISTIQAKGLSLLLFKDARVDQKILDETFGPFGWRRSHQELGGDLYCTVEIWDQDKGQWIGKQDVGTAGNAEKEKSRASDSFKRACFNWGIGRELYTAPFIWIPTQKVKIQERDGRYYSNERFRVQSIGYDGVRNIQALVIVNESGQKVYEFRSGKADVNKPDKEEKGTRNGIIKTTSESRLNPAQEQAMDRELERTGVALEAVLERYHIKNVDQMTEEIYQKAMKDLKRSKSRSAA